MWPAFLPRKNCCSAGRLRKDAHAQRKRNHFLDPASQIDQNHPSLFVGILIGLANAYAGGYFDHREPFLLANLNWYQDALLFS